LNRLLVIVGFAWTSLAQGHTNTNIRPGLELTTFKSGLKLATITSDEVGY
jgi:hypothetical protein